MRNVHKLLALLLSLAMVFALGVTAAAEDVTATPVPISAAEESPETAAAPGEIVILYTNDVHTYINKTLGYPSIAALKKELAAEGKSVTFISSEIDEMLRVCSRLVVMRDRQVVGELRGSDLTQSSIMKTIAGGEQA